MIAQVSGQLFRDGHYKQAALEAYIRVIDEVKTRSGLTLDGDSLVNRAFGCENQAPVIQFNSLQIDAEMDEYLAPYGAGSVTVLLSNVTVPFCVNPLPSSDEPAPSWSTNCRGADALPKQELTRP